MARPIRFRYPGAICHVMARGDGGKVVFETDDDRKSFEFRLGQICTSPNVTIEFDESMVRSSVGGRLPGGAAGVVIGVSSSALATESVRQMLADFP